MKTPLTLFLSGIDTDAGKTYATAYLAKRFMQQGLSVVTQKFIHTTAPIIFTYPASAQLAARIDGRDIDISLIDRSREILASRYDVAIIEGAGGLMVPFTDDFLTIDYPATRQLPVVLVTNGILGSINHTLLSLEAIKARGLELPYIIYNKYFDTDELIAEDTLGFIRRYVAKHFPGTEILEMPGMPS